MCLPAEMRSRLLVGAAAVLVSAAGCIEIDGSDARYIERQEKQFTVSGKPDVSVSTFDGAIEIRPWDRSEVNVVIEKRAWDKESAATIDVRTEQDANHIVVDVTVRRSEGFLHFDHRSAKLIVSMPAAANVAAKSGDGSINIEGISGKLDLRSGDGSIRGLRLDGEVVAHSGDGSIRLEGVKGALNVDTGDGSIVAEGAFTTVRARSGDGSVRISAERGSASTGDWDISTGDGSVTVALPDGFGAEIDAHTGDGRIHMQDLTISNVTGEIAKNTVRGRLGAGGSTVRVRTGDGSITLKRS